MMRLSLLTAVVLSCGALGAGAAGHVKRLGESISIRSSDAVRHTLRVCNAYAYRLPLDVYLHDEKLTAEAPLEYKSCGEFAKPLQAGDNIEFKFGDKDAGTFSAADLPSKASVLLLVVHRTDTENPVVSFDSHVFKNLLNGQVAVIDAYKGPHRAMMRIEDVKEGKMQRSEPLQYGSIVAVDPGTYEVVLVGQDGSSKAKADFVAAEQEDYVVMRVGNEPETGSKYEEELVVAPISAVTYEEKAPAPAPSTTTAPAPAPSESEKSAPPSEKSAPPSEKSAAATRVGLVGAAVAMLAAFAVH